MQATAFIRVLNYMTL